MLVAREGGDYSIDHSSSYTLIDPARRNVLTFRKAEPHLAAARIVAEMKTAGASLEGLNGALR